MITSRAIAAAAFSAALLAAGCAADRETTLSRSARQRQTGQLRAERERLQQERVVLQLQVDEQRGAITAARDESVRTAAELRAVMVALQHDLDRLQRAEQDLAAARARTAAIEQQLAAVHEAERRRDELAARLAAVTGEVAAAEQRLASEEPALRARLEALQQRLAAAQQVAAAVAAAEQAIAAALAQLGPAPPPAAAEAKK